MLTRDEMIEAIYEKIADKTLSFGCEVFIQNYFISVTIVGDNRGLTLVEGAEYEDFLGQAGTFTQSFSEKHIKNIIGHPVTIGYVLDYFNVDDWYDLIDIETDTDDTSIYNPSKYSRILELWKHKIKPIEEQSDDCIIYVYNLIK